MTSKVIVIVGPTAVGKTELSLRIAQKYHTEIISGDSIAVYKGLDIGSAKPSLEEQKKIKHHLINILNPQEDYSVAEFQAQARSIIETLPISIICGGTGLYIQAALFQYEFKAKKRNPSLEKQYASYTNEELFSYLLSIDPMLDLNKIHPNNRKRVLRAIEVKKSQGSSIHSFQHKNEPLYDYFIVYLNMERDLLYQRIHERVDTMIKQGLKEEVTALREAGIYPKGIGYKEWDAYFKGEASLEDVIELIKKNTRHLAKRQETWFKNQMNTHMYMLNATNRHDIYLQIENDIERWLKKMRIYLIGLPGVGKSTIGKKLAEKIEYRFLDLDSYIEQKAMLFVDEIFKLYGEEYFRALETNTLCEISKLDDVVISCGGGIVKSPKNKDYILGPCIYLKADIVQIEERLRESQIERPLLTTKTVLDLYKERKALYEDFATLEVENTDVEETIHLILKEIDI